MSLVNLSPAVRKQLERIDYETAIANQGILRGRPGSRFSGGSYLGGARRTKSHAAMEHVRAHPVHGYEAPAEHVREYTVREHTVPSHVSHRGMTTYQVPAEHVHAHTVHAHARRAHPVHGYEMPAHEQHVPHHPAHHVSPHIADLTARLQAMEVHGAHRSHHAHGGAHVGGAHVGGAYLGGRERKTDRPLSAYQQFQKAHLHEARVRALASGMSRQEAARAALAEVAAAWRAHKGE
jgi:hypothetical protein